MLTFVIENVGVTPATGPGIDTRGIGSGMILGYIALGGCPGLTAGIEETVGIISGMILGYGTVGGRFLSESLSSICGSSYMLSLGRYLCLFNVCFSLFCRRSSS